MTSIIKIQINKKLPWSTAKDFSSGSGGIYTPAFNPLKTFIKIPKKIHLFTGIGCRIAGFLTVFASQLSMYTLTIITIERWFAITKAIFLTRRLNRRNAYIIMTFGYVFSIILATFPLIGVSTYSATSICLPIKVERLLDVIYLLTLLAICSVGFAIMVFCYLHIYFHLHVVDVAEGAVFNRETAATKKMALLVRKFWKILIFLHLKFTLRFSQTSSAGHRLPSSVSPHWRVTASLT
jgi:hypothetical protein